MTEKLLDLIREYWLQALKTGALGVLSFKCLQIATCVVGRLLGRYVKLELEAFEEKIVGRVIEKLEEKFKKND